MEKEILKPEESLRIINDMISSAKTNLSDSSFNFLFWGWTISLLSLFDFIIDYFNLFNKSEYVWLLIIPGIIITFIYNYRKGKKQKTFSHIEKIHTFTWAAFMISYFIILVFMKELNYQITPLIFILVAIATFISGFILKFRPLIIGGVVFWLGAIFCFIIPNQFVQLLGSIVVIFGFLVPGYMLKSYGKKNA